MTPQPPEQVCARCGWSKKWHETSGGMITDDKGKVDKCCNNFTPQNTESKNAGGEE